MEVAQRSWRLVEFTAHTAPVNCLALGHKSGRVLVTGGDDKKVNLWAVGKENCIMSLSGHGTPIETVRFSSSEDMVCAGSRDGVLKVWDLEAAKIVRTLIGHQDCMKSVDFHPYAEFLASGSVDSTIKLWDIRKKGCIFTYRGHIGSVNSVKFSPDGQWIASGGEDSTVKIWDLRTGSVLHDFIKHDGPVLSVEYHPHEFLLASSSTDKTVHFWDLDKFTSISATEKQAHASRCIRFSEGGECLFAGACDTLNVFGWEPLRSLDTVFTQWSKIRDISTVGSQLIGAGYQAEGVMIYVVDLAKVCPIGKPLPPASPFAHGMSIRKSFNKQKPAPKSTAVKHQKAIEENETEPEDENLADIPDVNNYEAVFCPNRTLNRSPPPNEELFTPPGNITELNAPAQTSLHSGSQLAAETEEEYYEETEPSPKDHAPKSIYVSKNKLSSSSEVMSPVSSSICHTVSTLTSGMTHTAPGQNHSSMPASLNSLSPTSSSDHSFSRLGSANHADSSKEARSQSYDDPSKILARAINFYPKIRTSEYRILCRKTIGKIKNMPGPLKATTKRFIASLKTHRVCNFESSPSEPAISNSARKVGNGIGVKVSNNHKPELPPKPKYQLSVKQHQNNAKNIMMKPAKRPGAGEDDNIEYIPMTGDTPVGLEPNEFLPKRGSGGQLSEAEVISSVMRGHEDMMRVLISRQRNLQIIFSVWHTKDLKSAVEMATDMNDLSVVVDLLSALTRKPNLWSLDLCNLLLPSIRELLQSKYETYVTVGCDALRLILRNFSSVIRNNVQWSCPTIGVDITKEERYNKCKGCHNQLVSIRAFLLKRQTVQGKLGQMFRELVILLEAIDAT
ncbi:katanin p80 WD40 repeat-containing subunit B1 isoform X2 [Bemisia tabaci]|uniref:katanin p80 WD40 repeat-containing subunit B1 isoform X2 n=1 Tax=Bemisia tabaci TaxID=7038 RepID=UPI003B27CC01